MNQEVNQLHKIKAHVVQRSLVFLTKYIIPDTPPQRSVTVCLQFFFTWQEDKEPRDPEFIKQKLKQKDESTVFGFFSSPKFYSIQKLKKIRTENE